MTVLRLREALRSAALLSLIAAGPVQASSCLGVAGYGCSYLADDPVVQVVLPGALESLRPEPVTLFSILDRWHDNRGDTEWSWQRKRGDESVRRWTHDDAKRYVYEHRHHHRDRDFAELRHHWHYGGWDQHGDCHEGPPKPVPLPGAVLLFAPALLMLRAAQRRNA